MMAELYLKAPEVLGSRGSLRASSLASSLLRCLRRRGSPRTSGAFILAHQRLRGRLPLN